MGFITGVRRVLGLGGDDGGVGSVVRNVGQIELFGDVVSKAPFEEPPAYEVALDDDHLPWELGEHR
ncbi:hypothetical protein [Amnibacterium sp.]|uniref:hypothetical protein n=1 Tax=Amnibacterium sp. TaxID=1872496 RepID=UPI00261C3540|nr:hypothetical protein [Amnibacterium sp.]MCU1472853.1 hypothetical protein [Amnibacterium sp.]